MLHLNTCIFTILNELILDIFTTIIRFWELDFPPILVLNQCFKNLEEVKKFRVEFKELNPTIPGKFIYKGHNILGLTH